MDVRIDNVILPVPESFVDWTDYTFVSPDEDESLGVHFVESDPDTPSIEALAADMRERVIDFWEDEEVTIKYQGELNMLGSPGIELVLAGTGGEENAPFEESLVFMRLAQERFAFLNYYRQMPPQATEGVWKQVLASLTHRGGETAELPAGFVRYHLPQLSFAVPARLRPPGMYSFESPDELTSLTASIYTTPYQANSPQPRSMNDETANDAALGKISSAKRLPLPRGQSPGQIQLYELAEEDQVSLVHRAQIFLNHRRVHLCLKGPAQARHEQAAAWSEIVTRLASAEPE